MLRTARQRLQLAKKCPVARVADIVGDPCSLLIIRDLMQDSRRFGELQKSLAGISTRTLSNKLRRLCLEKLIRKNEALYILTTKGRGLGPVIDAMRAYGDTHL